MTRFLFRFRAILLLPVLVFARSANAADNEVWADNPWARVTIFGSGPLGTRLETEASIATEREAKSLFHLDAVTIPSELESFASSGPGAMASRAVFSIEASNESGLLVGGGVALMPEGGGGAGFSAIHAYLLVELTHPASIEIRDLVSTTPQAVDPGFSLALFQSDASGATHGGDVLSFAGASPIGWEAAHVSETPGFYLLQVTAEVEGMDRAEVEFAFRLDITEFVPVPEPATVALLFPGLAAIALCRLVGRRIQRRGTSSFP